MKSIISFFRKRPALVLFVLLFITFIPFLGETLFNTKGEPREAVVAVSMLQQHDFILPVSNGGDMPYKPPMLAWCIALFSMLTGGEVTEFTSRLPSAVAMIVMTMVTFLIARKHTSQTKAMMMALISMTAFEVNRAAYACRVDMLLTMFMVTAMFLLFDNYQKSKKIISVGAILLMSGGVLTKGPVGTVLPAATAWIYYLLRGENWFRATWQTAVNCIASLVLPAMWYVAAWVQGGDTFLSLMLEENVGRFTGTMSYDSHLNPWYYNVITVVAGLLPYTLLLVISLFFVKWRNVKTNVCSIRFAGAITKMRKADPWIVYNAVLAIFIFVFYCIPGSKRSVYLLPIYPSLAFFIAVYACRLYTQGAKALKIYAGIIATIAPLITLVFISLKIFDFSTGKESTDAFISAFHNLTPSIGGLLAIAASLMMSFYVWRAVAKSSGKKALRFALVALITVYWSFAAVYQPAALGVKSDKVVADELLAEGYGKDNPIYGYCSVPMLRYYTVNFYMGDCVINCEKNMPQNGVMIIGDRDLETWLSENGDAYDCTILKNTNHKSCDSKQKIMIVKLVKKSEKEVNSTTNWSIGTVK